MDGFHKVFYITGGTLPPSAECYVERTADKDLLDGILAGMYVYVLDSRQMGKSSLSVRTLDRLAEAGIRTAFVDLTKSGVRNLTAEQWFAAILREVGRGLGLQTEFVTYWKSNQILPPVQRLFGAIQDIALTAIPGQIAIMIDEIDVTRSLPFDTDEFFAGIRQCYVGRATDPALNRLTFSLFGTATPTELIEDTRVSPFNIGRRVVLQDFSLDEALVLSNNLPGDPMATLRRIFYWTGGHAYLTQRLCYAVSQAGTAGHVDGICRSIFLEYGDKEGDDNLAFVRNRLLKNEVDRVALLELYAGIHAGRDVRDDDANPLCAVLRMSGIVRVENGLLKVRNRIYARVFDRQWVREQLPDAEIRRQRSAFRRGVLRATLFGSAAVSLVAGLAAYGFYQARRAEAATRLASTRLSSSLLADGLRHLDQGDPAGAVPPLSAALHEEAGDPSRAEYDLLRVNFAIRSAANLRQLWSGKGDMLDAEFINAGKAVFTANADGALRVWNPETGAAMSPPMNVPSLSCVAVARDGRHALTGGTDGIARWWDLGRGKQEWSLPGFDKISAIGISEDGSKVAIGDSRIAPSGDGQTKVTVVSTVTPSMPKDPVDRIRGAELRTLVFAPNGNRLILGSRNYITVSIDLGDGQGNSDVSDCYNSPTIQFLANGRLLLVNGAGGMPGNGNGMIEGLAQLCKPNGELIAKYRAREVRDGDGSAFCLSSDESSLLVASNSGTLQTFDIRTGALVGSTIRVGVRINDCAISPDGQLACVACGDGSVRLWSLATGAPYGSVLWHGSPVHRIQFDPSGKRLLSFSRDGTARLWALSVAGTAEVELLAEKNQERAFWGWSERGFFATVTSNGIFRRTPAGGISRIFVGWIPTIDNPDWRNQFRIPVVRGDEARIADLETGTFLTASLPAVNSPESNKPVIGVEAGGRFAYNQCPPGRLKIYDLPNNAQVVADISLPANLSAQPALEGFQSVVRILPEADRVFTLCQNRPIDVWTLHGGRHIGQISGSEMNFSPDETQVVTMEHHGNTGTLRAYGTQDGRLRSGDITLNSFMPNVSFTPDSSRFITTRDATQCLVYDAQSWQLLKAYPQNRARDAGSPYNMRIQLSPDSKTLFDLASRRFCDLRTGDPLTPPILETVILDAEFSRDGRFLAVSTDTDAFVFDTQCYKLLAGPLWLGTAPVVGFTPDSKMLFTSLAGAVRFWNPSTGEEVLPSEPCRDTRIDFAPDSSSYTCRVGEHLVLRRLSVDRRDLGELDRAAAAVSRATLAKLDSDAWGRLKGEYAALSGGDISSGKWESTADSPHGADQVLEDAARDAGIQGDDKQGLLLAAESSARAAQWGAASNAIDEAIRHGAKGQEVWFLRGLIELRQGKYSAATEAFTKIVSSRVLPSLGRARFQALVGAGRYAEAAAALRSVDDLQTNARPATDALYAALAQAASGDMVNARASVRRQFPTPGKDDSRFDSLLPLYASVVLVTETGSGRMHELDQLISAIGSRDPLLRPERALALARSGMLDRAQALLVTPTFYDEPVELMARALVRQSKQADRAAFAECIRDCDAIVLRRDARTMESCLKLLRAESFKAEAKMLLISGQVQNHPSSVHQ